MEMTNIVKFKAKNLPYFSWGLVFQIGIDNPLNSSRLAGISDKRIISIILIQLYCKTLLQQSSSSNYCSGKSNNPGETIGMKYFLKQIFDSDISVVWLGKLNTTTEGLDLLPSSAKTSIQLKDYSIQLICIYITCS